MKGKSRILAKKFLAINRRVARETPTPKDAADMAEIMGELTRRALKGDPIAYRNVTPEHLAKAQITRIEADLEWAAKHRKPPKKRLKVRRDRKTGKIIAEYEEVTV